MLLEVFDVVNSASRRNADHGQVGFVVPIENDRHANWPFRDVSLVDLAGAAKDL